MNTYALRNVLSQFPISQASLNVSRNLGCYLSAGLSALSRVKLLKSGTSIYSEEMPPSCSSSIVAQARFGDSILSAKFIPGHAGYVILKEACKVFVAQPASIKKGFGHAPLHGSIQHVIPMRSCPQMAWVYAWRVITGMKYEIAIGYGAFSRLVGKAMRKALRLGSSRPEEAVSFVVFIRRPYPAIISFLDFGPKSFSKEHLAMMGHYPLGVKGQVYHR